MTVVNRAAAQASAVQIRDETGTAANTATRVGTAMLNQADSVLYSGLAAALADRTIQVAVAQTTAAGLVLHNPTAASANDHQYSPALVLQGESFSAGSRFETYARTQLRTTTGAIVPTLAVSLGSAAEGTAADAASLTDALTLTPTQLALPGSLSAATFVAVGASPATTGAGRFTNAEGLYWENGADNIRGLVGFNGDLFVGEQVGATAPANLFLFAATTVQAHLNGALKFAITDTSVDFYPAGALRLTITGTTADFQNVNIVTAGFIAAGSGTVAGSGAIRLNSSGSINAWSGSTTYGVIQATAGGVLLGGSSSAFNTHRSLNVHAFEVGAGNAPALRIHDGGLIDVESNFTLRNIQSTNDASGPAFQFFKDRTGGATPLVSQNDVCLYISASGHDGSTYQTTAVIQAVFDQPTSAGNVPTAWQFYTGPAATPLLRLMIESTGQINAFGNVVTTGGRLQGTAAGVGGSLDNAIRLLLVNVTPATSSADLQYSPQAQWVGNVWDPASSSSKPSRWNILAAPFSVDAKVDAVIGRITFAHNWNDGGAVAIASLNETLVESGGAFVQTGSTVSLSFHKPATIVTDAGNLTLAPTGGTVAISGAVSATGSVAGASANILGAIVAESVALTAGSAANRRLTIGANAADTGDIGLKNDCAIKARNALNTDNRDLLRFNNSNHMLVGDVAVQGVDYHTAPGTKHIFLINNARQQVTAAGVSAATLLAALDALGILESV